MINMTPLILGLLFTVSINAAPYPDNSIDITSDRFNTINLQEDPRRLARKLDNTKDYKIDGIGEKSPEMQNTRGKKSRWHKAFFFNSPYFQSSIKSTMKYSPSSLNDSYKDGDEKHTAQRKHTDSKIYYVRLPPAPYFFVPGLGYISNPPKFSTSSLKPYQSYPYHTSNSFINLPIDFVSNGKPTSVYQWNKNHKPSKKPINSMMKLKKGPYGFNGKPTGLYLLGPNGEKSMHQPIRYTDIQDNNIKNGYFN